MNILKNSTAHIFILSILALPLGVFLFIFGGWDDSPGAQGLGLLVFLAGAYSLVKKRGEENL